MRLQLIGADQRVREQFRPHQAEGLELARVSFAAHEQYRVWMEAGECDAAPAGRLRWEDDLPGVGDWVAARPVDANLALIEAVLPRRTAISRRTAGAAAGQQVMAANLDLAVIVCGLDGDFNLRRLERYLVLAAESRAEAVIVLNKADLCEAYAERVEAVERIAAGATCLALSAIRSVDALRTLVRNRTVVLLGSSGAGKSTIVNALLGDERQATAEVRADDSRGRHTTTNRMLLPLPGGGAIIDTPGLRELQLWAGEESLEQAFDEIAALARRCRFADCTHTGEPGCAVREAREQGEIDEDRWTSYRKLSAELRHHALEQDVHARQAEKRRWKAIHKSLKLHPKYRH